MKPLLFTLLALGLAACGSTRIPGMDFARPEVRDSGSNTQCVPFARDESGIQIYGDANLWWQKAANIYERAYEPEEGAVMVMLGYKNPNRGHVAVVKRVISGREIVVDHANWLNDGRIYLDQPVKDVSANNDWSAVKVWYAPGAQYGARTYQVQGFILPHMRYAAARN
jgi:surface antigen